VEAQQSNPGARFAKIPDAGHMVFWDNPGPALQLLRAALADLTP
jgi:N-formylmaleamate deformylase